MVSNASLAGLAAAVAIAGAATYVAWRLAPDPNAPPRARLLLPDIDAVNAFEFTRGSLRIACSRDAKGVWTLEHPLVGRADEESVRALLDAIATAPVHETLTGRDLRRRGVSDSDIALVASADGGPRLVLSRPGGASAELAFGTNVVDGRLYVEILGQPGRLLRAVDGALLDALPAAVAPFRDKRLIPFPEERLQRLDIRYGPSAIFLERTADGWWLRKPIDARASESETERLLRYLFSRRADFDDAPSAPSAIAAERSLRHCTPDEASASLRLSFSDTGAAPRTIERLFGDPDDASPRLWVYATEDASLARTDTDLLAALAIDPETLRDHRLFPDRRAEDVDTLRVAAQDVPPLAFRHDPDGFWSLVQPVPLRARPGAVDAFADAILRLEDTGLVFPDVPQPDASASPTPLPPATVPAPDRLATLSFDFRDGSSLTASVARAAAPDPGGTVWTLPLGPVRRIPAGSPAIAPWDPAALRALLDPVILLDAGDGTPLVAARVEAVAPLSVEPYGLVEPAAVLTLAGGETTLLIGGRAPDGTRYAMLRGAYTVYALPAETADALFAPTPEPPLETP